MPLDAFLHKVASGEPVSFQESIAAIADHYDYTPTAFSNGGVDNPAGVNEGSCKLFYFAQLHGLTPEQALSLFGDYYRLDVLGDPGGQNHANLRAFMREGWAGVVYAGPALRAKV